MARIVPPLPEHWSPSKRQKTKPKPKPLTDGSSVSTTTTAPAPPSTPKTAADYYVKSIPGLDPPTKLSIYAGHIASTLQSHPPQPFDSDASLYFLLAKNRHIPKRERLLIWCAPSLACRPGSPSAKLTRELTRACILSCDRLNGGPGCSSFDGA